MYNEISKGINMEHKIAIGYRTLLGKSLFWEIFDLFLIQKNNKTLINHIQRAPPNIPVNSYHWIHLTFDANELPMLSQGHEISQLRWMYSQLIQKTGSESHLSLLKKRPVQMAAIQGIVMNKLFSVNAATAGIKAELATQNVVQMFHTKNVW